MGDFGRILEEWESMRRGSQQQGVDGSRLPRPCPTDQPDRASWLERAIEQYPVVDKDADDESASAQPLRPEQVPVDDSLDLHGYTRDEALTATGQFIAASAARGLRKVMVIHGKGRNGEGVLKREVRQYLERHPLVGRMGYARGPDGGRGALWALLRHRMKGRGSVSG